MLFSPAQLCVATTLAIQCFGLLFHAYLAAATNTKVRFRKVCSCSFVVRKSPPDFLTDILPDMRQVVGIAKFRLRETVRYACQAKLHSFAVQWAIFFRYSPIDFLNGQDSRNLMDEFQSARRRENDVVFYLDGFFKLELE